MKFSRINILTGNGLFMMLLFAIVIIGSLIPTIQHVEVSLIANLIFIVLDIIVLGIVIWGFTSRVEIIDEGIRYTSFLGDKFIDWKDVKSYGIYVVGRGVKQTIKKEDYYRRIWGTQKFIYVSDNDFIPGLFKFKHGKRYIDFHFREEAMKMIESRIEIIKESLSAESEILKAK